MTICTLLVCLLFVAAGVFGSPPRGGIGPSNRRAIVGLRSRPVDRDTPGNPIKTGSLALPGPIRAGLTPWPEGPAATYKYKIAYRQRVHIVIIP